MSQDKNKRMEWSSTEPNKIRTLLPLASAAQVRGQRRDQEDRACESRAHPTCQGRACRHSGAQRQQSCSPGKHCQAPQLKHPSGHPAEVQPFGALISRRYLRHKVCC